MGNVSIFLRIVLTILAIFFLYCMFSFIYVYVPGAQTVVKAVKEKIVSIIPNKKQKNN